MAELLGQRVRVYYRNDVFDGDVADIPSPLGVIAIAVPDCRGSGYETGRMVLHSAEYYVCIDGDWFPLQHSADLIDHVLHSQPERVLKGRWIPDEEFEAVIARAMDDPGMPPRSGRRPRRETGAD